MNYFPVFSHPPNDNFQSFSIRSIEVPNGLGGMSAAKFSKEFHLSQTTIPLPPYVGAVIEKTRDGIAALTTTQNRAGGSGGSKLF